MPTLTRSALIAATAMIALPVAADAPAPAPFTLKLTGLRSQRGRVGCALYASPRGFPADIGSAVQRRWCRVEGLQSTCRFDPIVRGTYATACFHDENANGRLDRGLFGLPKEGTIVSNYATRTFGLPRWNDAKFAFSGRPTEIALKMSY
jgi:uncharacterized protein (DUF2141 family)